MNTQDLSKLGYREIDLLADLLKAYSDAEWNSKDDELGDEVKWEYNPNSDNLFLVDEYYRVAMINDDGKLENWLNCGNCGKEGFRSEVDFCDDSTCKECHKEEKSK